MCRRGSGAIDEADILRRALALRWRGKIGVLWADGGWLWISESELDPDGRRVGVTLGEMAALAEVAEAQERMPARSAASVVSEAVSISAS